jgi:hypothetical protein
MRTSYKEGEMRTQQGGNPAFYNNNYDGDDDPRWLLCWLLSLVVGPHRSLSKESEHESS